MDVPRPTLVTFAAHIVAMPILGILAYRTTTTISG